VWAGCGASQDRVLAERLGMASAFVAPSLPPPPAAPRSPDHEGMVVGVAVLSRWHIRRARIHRLPATHRHEPVALVATLDHPAGPLPVVVSCVEWEPDYADDHLAQTRALAALVSDPALDGPLPVVLAADLNAPPGSPEVRALTEAMVDTWEAGGGDPGAVTLSSGNPFAPAGATKQIDQRIDYVLARPGTAGRPVTVRRAFVADATVDGLPPSDHYAVVADLAVDRAFPGRRR
jgi:endonuclease/exonuclease/phosphatase family metal-dependent hydrolase